ncbi:MAG: PEP-CTERM sorting domain-containing protein [Isosphaeraceae bacterium]
MPEPSTYVLGCTAILLLGVCQRRKSKKS